MTVRAGLDPEAASTAGPPVPGASAPGASAPGASAPGASAPAPTAKAGTRPSFLPSEVDPTVFDEAFLRQLERLLLLMRSPVRGGLKGGRRGPASA